MKLSYATLVAPVLWWWMVRLTLIEGSLTEKPTFRIIAPEFICNPAEGRPSSTPDNSSTVAGINRGNSTQSARQLTIGFQTNGGHHLHYRVKTYFTLLSETGFISQRHTVGLWRAVRQLEQRIRRDRDVIAQRGQMTIGTDELLPGVVYSFGVIAVDSDGVESEEQNFTMTYRDVDQGASFEHGGTTRSGKDVSLLMLGAEKTYADVDYLMTAQLIFCRRRNDYFYRWNIGGMNDSEPVAVAMERSKLLKVPAGSFFPGQQYTIEVSVYSTSTVEEMIARALMTVTVLHRVRSVVLFPVDAVVGIDQTVPVRSYVPGGDEVMWSCQKLNEEESCDDPFDAHDGDAIVTFHKEGQYVVKASSALAEAQEQCTLLVHPKVTPTVRVLQWSQYPAVAGEPFELLVSVAGLVPKCYSNWTVLKGEDGYEYFDPAQLPKGTLGGLYIRDVEENFLAELVDYGNDTVVKDVTLSIPGGIPAGPWKGLEPNARYKLRLETICPEPIDDSKMEGSATSRKAIQSHWTFMLETNGAPEGLPVAVSPESNGTALETLYKISTGIAKDTAPDYPLRYSFWYVADGVNIHVATYYEITSAETVLPYTKTGCVATYVIVCDSRNACSKIIGPDVCVLPGVEPTEEEVSYALESVGAFFDRLNFRDALKNAFELVITLKNRNSSQYENAYRRFTEQMQQSIAHIRKVYSETMYLSDASVQEFVVQAKPILDLEESNNHELFQQLLELMEPSIRPKRSSSPMLSSPSESVTKINTKLSLMESLTVSKNVSVARQARTSLLSFVHQATKNYCVLDAHHVFVGQLITLEMDRYRRGADINFSNMSVPNHVLLSSPIGRGKLLDAFPDTEYLCVGRVYYARDLFVEREMHELDLGFYEAFVLSVEKGGMWTLVDWRNDYFLWSLDGRRLPNVTCQLWDNDRWSSKDCVTVETITDEVHCNCTRMAYLRISNETESALIEDATEYSTMEPFTSTSSISSLPQSIVSTISPEAANTTEATKTTTTLMTTSQPTTVDPTVGTMAEVVTATESDMVTLADSTTEATENFPAAVPSPNTSNVDNGPSALLQGGGNDTGTAILHSRSLVVSSIGYTIAGALAIAMLTLTVLTVIYRRRNAVLRLADELHSVPSRARTQPSPHVRYARFQDEHNMTGDNVSTISDVLTI